MAKACACPGAAKTGPATSRGMVPTGALARAAASASIAAMSGGLQIGLERLDGHPHARIAVLSPELPPIKAHGIEPLRILAAAKHRRIGKDVASLDALNATGAAARI